VEITAPEYSPGADGISGRSRLATRLIECVSDPPAGNNDRAEESTMAFVPRTGVVLSLVLLLDAVAGATTVRPREVTCPVCEEEITVLAVTSSNSFGGPDYDLCGHAAGDSPRSFGVWTCPLCLYSRYAGEFEEPPDAAIRKRIRTELKSPVEIPEHIGQRGIPVWVKYRLAMTIREWEGASPAQLARMGRAAAWATRCESGNALRPIWRDAKLGKRHQELGDEEWKRTEQLETQAPGEIFFRCRLTIATADRHLEAARSKDVAPVDAMLRRLLAASGLRYRGENPRALKALESLGGKADLPEPVRKAVEGLRLSIEKEREFQEAWIGHFARIVDDGLVEGDELAIYGYIAGDNLRRLGRVEEAAKWIRRSLESGEGPAWLTGAATAALLRMGMKGPSKEKLAEVRKKRIAGAVARLHDPKTAEDADHELRALRAPEALPGILSALDHEHPYVRSAAAFTLGFQPEPSDAAIDRLGRVLLEDEEQDPRLRAALSLARIGDPRSRDALEKSLDPGPPQGLLHRESEGGTRPDADREPHRPRGVQHEGRTHGVVGQAPSRRPQGLGPCGVRGGRHRARGPLESGQHPSAARASDGRAALDPLQCRPLPPRDLRPPPAVGRDRGRGDLSAGEGGTEGRGAPVARLVGRREGEGDLRGLVP
jgi:hypothetical protein